MQKIKDMLLPNFNVRSSGGAFGAFNSGVSGALWSGAELVNQISGKTSRSGRTCAKERKGIAAIAWRLAYAHGLGRMTYCGRRERFDGVFFHIGLMVTVTCSET